MPYSRQPYTLDRTVRLVINCVLFLCAIWLVNTLKGVLLPFLVGCLIAYILEPAVQLTREVLRLKGRVLATFITLFELLFFFLLLLYFIVPVITDEAAQMAAMFKTYAAKEPGSIPFIPSSVHDFLKKNIDFEMLASKLTREEWSKMIEQTLSASWSLITSSVGLIMSLLSWLIVFLYVIFIMIDYEKLARGFRRMIPPKYRHRVFGIANDVKISMNRYFRGQALVALIVGILFSIGFYIIGLPLAIVLGLFIGLLNMVPYLQLISLIPCTVLCMIYSVDTGISFWTLFWECFAVYCIVQVLQDLVITPKIIGKAMSMNPALIFLSLSVWGTLLGFIGLIIAIPLTTLLLSYYDRYIIAPRERKPRHTPAT